MLKSSTGLTGQVRVEYLEHAKLNVFCMYIMTERSTWVDPENFKCGDTCLVIGRYDVFLRRVKVAFDALLPNGMFTNLNADVVRYVDKNIHTGDMAPFVKYNHFEYQSEYRIVLSPGLGKSFVLNVGSLEDIAYMMPLAKINDLITINRNLLPPKS